MWTVSHTHTQSSGGLPEDLIESRELLLPWQRQLPSSITTRFLSFIVFIPSFFCCPLYFLQMSLCHDAFKVSHNALWNVASGHRSLTLIRQLRGVTLQGVCSVWDSCTETPSAANTSAWRESWVEAGCKAAATAAEAIYITPTFRCAEDHQLMWAEKSKEDNNTQTPTLRPPPLGWCQSESWTPEQLLQEDKMIGYIQTDPSVQSQ